MERLDAREVFSNVAEKVLLILALKAPIDLENLDYNEPIINIFDRDISDFVDILIKIQRNCEIGIGFNILDDVGNDVTTYELICFVTKKLLKENVS